MLYARNETADRTTALEMTPRFSVLDQSPVDETSSRQEAVHQLCVWRPP
jgi:hypothetical protein